MICLQCKTFRISSIGEGDEKGVYVDGHEREDVVRDRQDRFLPEIEQVLSECVRVEVGEDGAITFVNEDAPYILVSVDQKAHKSNETPSW